jgi:TIR domain
MAWRVFYSYSHKDSDPRDLLRTFLAPLKHSGKIEQWDDREIKPGLNWQTEINKRIETADLIVFLISPDFLNSEYCLGVEVEKALERLKTGAVTVVPILMRECLWEESIFSELQMIPRGGKAIFSRFWQSTDEAFKNVAKEIRDVVAAPPPASPPLTEKEDNLDQLEASLDLVRQQIRSYARLYERTRLRMRPSDERTERMEEIASHMRALATASYPLLDEFVRSPFPGERLAAITIMQVFGTQQYLGFLVNLVGSEKPFLGYHAIRALSFAVDSLDPSMYPKLSEALDEAAMNLERASVGFDSGRQAVLRESKVRLQDKIAEVSRQSENYD